MKMDTQTLEGRLKLTDVRTGRPVLAVLQKKYPLPTCIKLNGFLWLVALEGNRNARKAMKSATYERAIQQLRRAGIDPEACVVETPRGWRGYLSEKIIRYGANKFGKNLD
jgi:hypothetical protein